MTPTMLHQRNKSLWIVLVLAIFTLFTGCAQKDEMKMPVFEEWRTKVETSRPNSPSAPVRDLALPETQPEKPAEPSAVAPPPAPHRPLPTKKVTMTMRNTDVNVILRALALAAGQNIMMNSGVTGVTQINVENTPWDQVFLAVLRTRGLTYAWEGDIIRVMSIEDLRHDQDIEDIQQKRKAQEMESKKVEPMFTKVIPLNYYTIDQLKEFTSIEKNTTTTSTDSTDDKDEDKRKIEEMFEKLLSLDDKGQKLGSVTADTQTNSIVVHGFRDDIAKIAALVEELDKPITQVLLEAHIVETNKDTARALGIQWGGLYHGETAANAGHWITAGSRAFNAAGDLTSLGAGTVVNMPADLTSMTPNTGLALGFLGEKVGNYLLNIQLSALEEANKLHILSSPSITTLNNQMAVIESGASIPYQASYVDDVVTISFKDATLRLEVTPHVIDRETLKLMIIINKDEVDFSRKVLGNPAIIKKTAKTNLILNDGATTVIGGLSKETATNADAGVPGLKDIPGLGYLFKNKGNSNEMEEVLIFITPHILKEKKAAGQ